LSAREKIRRDVGTDGELPMHGVDPAPEVIDPRGEAVAVRTGSVGHELALPPVKPRIDRCHGHQRPGSRSRFLKRDGTSDPIVPVGINGRFNDERLTYHPLGGITAAVDARPDVLEDDARRCRRPTRRSHIKPFLPAGR